jgi:ComF family protein
MIKEALKELSYAVFPKRCELCGEVVELDAKLCEDCMKSERITGKLCNKCGKPKEDCSCDKRTRTPEYKRVIAPYYYEGSIAAGANRFKDYGFPELGLKMSEEIISIIDEQYKEIEFDIVTFVPLTNEKLKKRGYNQSELLAKKIAEHMILPCLELVSKIRETPQQKRSNARQRRVNLRGSFDLAKDIRVENKTILIIDDIKTTGSTLNECAYVLNAYGAKAVYAAAFCMTK